MGAGKGKDTLRTASTLPGGKARLCGAWNSHKGCTRGEAQCPQRALHRCSVILADGTICQARDHPAVEHYYVVGRS